MALSFCSGDSMNYLVVAGELESGKTVGSKAGQSRSFSEYMLCWVEVVIF